MHQPAPMSKQRLPTSRHVDAAAQLGFTVTHIDFGSLRVSAHHKLGDLSVGATKISGFAHNFFVVVVKLRVLMC